MDSDEDTRRGTSPEKVNEYRRKVWEHADAIQRSGWRPSAVALEQSSGLGRRDFSQALSRRHVVYDDTMSIYRGEEKRKSRIIDWIAN